MNGGDAFYDEVLAPLESRMLRTVWRVVHDPDRARDALQSALALLWERRERVRAHPNPEALVLRICAGAAVDLLRRERRRARTEEAEKRTRPAPPPRRDGEAAVERRELREEVLAAVRSLPPRQAAAVLLRVVEEQDYREIARTLGCAQATARIHVMRARAALGRRLAHLDPGAARGGGGE